MKKFVLIFSFFISILILASTDIIQQSYAQGGGGGGLIPPGTTCADCDDLVQQCKDTPDGSPDSVCEAFGDDCRAQLCFPVGGEMIPLDTTALLVAGTYSTASWLIPAIVSAIGIGIVIARKF